MDVAAVPGGAVVSTVYYGYNDYRKSPVVDIIDAKQRFYFFIFCHFLRFLTFLNSPSFSILLLFFV